MHNRFWPIETRPGRSLGEKRPSGEKILAVRILGSTFAQAAEHSRLQEKAAPGRLEETECGEDLRDT